MGVSARSQIRDSALKLGATKARVSMGFHPIICFFSVNVQEMKDGRTCVNVFLWFQKFNYFDQHLINSPRFLPKLPKLTQIAPKRPL